MVEYLNTSDISLYKDFIKEVFDYEINEEVVKKFLKKNKILVIKEDDKIIGSVTIEQRFEFVKNQKYYFLSYLGVSKKYRRMGYASRLFEKVEELVQKNEIKYIELTSGNQRRSAHYFYKSKNFKIKDTTVFVKLY